MSEKEHWRPNRRIYYRGPWTEAYHRGLKENPITEDPYEDPITEKPKENPRGPSGASKPSMTFPLQKTLFFFLVMVYDRVDDGDKRSFETFGLGRLHFNAISHLKTEVKRFFMNTKYIFCKQQRFKSRAGNVFTP